MTQPSSAPLLDLIRQSLQSNGYVRFRVTSNSMWPLIRAGDWVEVSALKPDAPILPGDIVVCRRASNFLLHRVFRIQNDLVFTKGDRTRSIDLPVSRADILARLVKIQKGKFGCTLSNPLVNLIQRSIGRLSALLARKPTFTHPSGE